MPTYDYVCDNCGHEFELFQSMKDDPIQECPECHEKAVRRLIGSGAGIIFKGSGFYETDYKRKSGTNGNGATSSKSSSSTAPSSDSPKPKKKKTKKSKESA
ncbi:MAG: zinc ribbon domain-containing protein [bacterium]|jgi:putative FmdB family regulatory protein|nr:zinc ribbon domain-containing protein [bacterium]